MQIRNYSPQTIRSYISSLKALSNYYNLSPAKISLEQFKLYLAGRVSRFEISSSSVNQIIGAWRILQCDILKREWINFEVKRPRPEKKLPHVLSQKKLVSLIASITNTKHHALISLAYATGMRRNEILQIKIEDIDSDRNVIIVKHGKGNKQRQIPINTSLIEILRNYYVKYRPIKFLFEGQQPGMSYSATSFSKILKKAANKISISKPVSPHILRHSFATHSLENGLNLKQLQLILGHNSMKTTSIYLHVADTTAINIPDLLNPIKLR